MGNLKGPEGREWGKWKPVKRPGREGAQKLEERGDRCSLSVAVPVPSCSQSTLLLKAGSMSMENPRGGISETNQKARKERCGKIENYATAGLYEPPPEDAIYCKSESESLQKTTKRNLGCRRTPVHLQGAKDFGVKSTG